VRHRDQARRGGRAPQRIHPPGEIVVRVLAQHGHHDVPPSGAELTHGPRQVGRGLDLGAAFPDHWRMLWSSPPLPLPSAPTASIRNTCRSSSRGAAAESRRPARTTLVMP